MRMVDILEKKRDGFPLTKEEIRFVVDGYTNGDIPDYQMSAFLMAVYFQGMNEEETVELTRAMAESGDQLDLSQIEGIKVDKHSTGGVGDKVSLILGPLVAAVGVPVAKMSGRGLGHTGGTIDKLESIPGFQTELSDEEFIRNVNEYKLAIIGQTGNLTPADKKIYALRDVTGTVHSIPLIASSIMSKKIAAGADRIVLDVKTGSGAFMKTLEDAEKLARTMVDIGNGMNRKTVAMITNMDQPLGFAVGNALEVKEAIQVLAGKGPKDLEELCLALGTKMVVLAEKAATDDEARKMLEDVIQSGEALNVFKKFIEAQGGDSSVVDDVSKLPEAPHQIPVQVEESGYVVDIQANEIGVAAMMLGAGRQTKDDVIDMGVAIVLHKKVGDYVERGAPIAPLYRQQEQVSTVEQKVIDAYTLSEEKPEVPPLIYKVIE